MKKRWLVLIIAVLAIGFAFYSFQKFEKKEINTYKIGFAGDLSNSPPARNSLLGVEIAVEELNSKAEATGKRYGLIAYDTKGENASIEEYFSKLANDDKVLAVVSTHINQSGIAESLKVPAIFTGPNRMQAKKRDMFFWGIELSTITTDLIIHSIAKLQEDASIGSAVIVTDNEPPAGNYNPAMKIALNAAKIALLGEYVVGDDIAQLISKIKESNPDMVVISTNTENAIRFLQEARKSSLKPKIFFGGFGIINRKIVNAEGLPDEVYLHEYIVPQVRAPINPKATAPYYTFDRKVAEKAKNNKTEAVSLNAYNAVYYLDWIIRKNANVSNAIKSLQDDRKQIASAFWRTRDYVAFRGRYFADGKTGLLRISYYRMSLIKNGKEYIMEQRGF